MRIFAAQSERSCPDSRSCSTSPSDSGREARYCPHAPVGSKLSTVSNSVRNWSMPETSLYAMTTSKCTTLPPGARGRLRRMSFFSSPGARGCVGPGLGDGGVVDDLGGAARDAAATASGEGSSGRARHARHGQRRPQRGRRGQRRHVDRCLVVERYSPDPSPLLGRAPTGGGTRRDRFPRPATHCGTAKSMSTSRG